MQRNFNNKSYPVRLSVAELEFIAEHAELVQPTIFSKVTTALCAIDRNAKRHPPRPVGRPSERLGR